PILAQWCEILFLLELLLELRPVNFHKSLPHTRFGLEARVGIERGFVKFTTPELPSHHQRRVTHNYRTTIESGIPSRLSSTRDNSDKRSNYSPKRRQNTLHWHFHWHFFSHCGKTRVGIGRLKRRF